MVRWLVLVVVLSGCGTTATITTYHRTVEARVEKGDADNLVAVTDWGHREVIPRREIYDIDHPGNALAVVGATLAGMGLIDLAALSSQCFRGTGAGSVCAGAMAFLVTGAPMLVWGMWTWLRSRSAAEAPPEGSVAPVAVPVPCSEVGSRPAEPVVMPPPALPRPPDAPVSEPPAVPAPAP